jgi:hypothetical protein
MGQVRRADHHASLGVEGTGDRYADALKVALPGSGFREKRPNVVRDPVEVSPGVAGGLGGAPMTG